MVLAHNFCAGARMKRKKKKLGAPVQKVHREPCFSFHGDFTIGFNVFDSSTDQWRHLLVPSTKKLQLQCCPQIVPFLFIGTLG